MKRGVTLFCIMLFSTLAYGQIDYQINTLDSITSTNQFQGVYGLTAETYGDNVHLTYVYGNVEGEWFLMYEVRKNGDQLLKEEAYQFSDAVLVSPETAIQFDADGDPHIYCAGVSGGQAFITIASRKNNVWNIAPFSYNNRVHLNASKDGSQYLGFVSKSGVYPYPIVYFGNIDGLWADYTLSYGGHLTSEAAALTHGEDEYAAFLEHHHPDTTVLFIYKRSDQGPWMLDYEESVLQAVPWQSFDGRWCMFGVHGGTLHFVHTMHSEGNNSLMTHLVNTGGVWETQSSGHLDTYGNERSNCNALEFDNDGNLYFVFLHENVWWMNSQEESFLLDVAAEGVVYEYYDIAILGTDIYQYFISGDKNYPFGDPLVFYEAIGSLEDLTDVKDLEVMNILYARVVPNPASEHLRLELESEVNQDLFVSWYDIQGRKLPLDQTIFSKAGQTMVDLSGHNLSSGLYFIHIYNKSGQISLPVVIK